MDPNRRRIGAALAVLSAFHLAAAAGAVSRSGAPAARGVRVDAVNRYWKSLAAIGFRGVGLVAQGGSVLLLEGSGGVSPRATFDVASIAKPLTAVAVLRAARRGALGLDDPLSRFFPDAPADKRAITVHQLLTHTGGIGNSTGDTASGVKNRGEAVRMILATPLVGPPGKGHSYSNDGYTLLAAILEVARSTTWEAVVREEVLRPAGMDHTFFAGEPWPSGPRAVAQATVMDVPQAAGPANGREADWGCKGGAGIFSTAEDLMRFMNAAASGALLGPGGAAEIGKSYAPPGDLQQYSRVFRVVDFPGRGAEWSHGGADTADGHNSHLFYYLDSKIVLVVLGLDDEDLVTQVASGLGNALFGEGVAEVPPALPGHPATGFAAPMTLAGEGLRFTIAPGGAAARLLPENAVSTSFLLARSAREREDLERCVRQTRQLLDEVAQAATAGAAPPDDPVGHLVTAWREAGSEDGVVKEVTVLGATPNWADSLGGMLAFVRVAREKRTTVFRLYWRGAKLTATLDLVTGAPPPAAASDAAAPGAASPRVPGGSGPAPRPHRPLDRAGTEGYFSHLTVE